MNGIQKKLRLFYVNSILINKMKINLTCEFYLFFRYKLRTAISDQFKTCVHQTVLNYAGLFLWADIIRLYPDKLILLIIIFDYLHKEALLFAYFLIFEIFYLLSYSLLIQGHLSDCITLLHHENCT